MLDSIRFVQGSVAKKEFLPSLTHFVIEDNTIRGYDGTMALCAPILLDINCKPKAEPFYKAVAACGDDGLSLTMTPNGRLSVKSGSKRFLIDCHPDESTPHAKPHGEFVHQLADGQVFYEALETIAPFIGNDASRPWSNGVLLENNQMFATNNIILTNIWHGQVFPHRICIPAKAVKEVLRVKQAPISLQLSSTTITFHFPDGRWIFTQLIPTDGWPDIGRVLDKQVTQPPTQVDPALFDALRTIKPFVNKMSAVYMGEGRITTTLADESGATVDLASVTHTGVFGLEMLLLLEGVAQNIDWAAYPSACLWFGKKLRGAIIGQRGG